MEVKKRNAKQNFIWRKSFIILFWLLVWQLLTWLVGNKILLEGPLAVIKRLFEDLQTTVYYQTVGASLLRIVGGFLCGTILAVVVSIIAGKYPLAGEILMPVVQFLKAAPITCFVVLLLIWAGSGNLAFYIAVLVAFPPVYFNLLEGIRQIDRKLIEVAKVYRMPLRNRLRYIYLPGVEPYFISALSLAIGTAFKAGVAAEIIGTPDYSMGERIYMSKIYLDTAGVLSWMITIILVAYLCEKLFVKMAVYYFHKKPAVYVKRKKQGEADKKYLSEDVVLDNCTVAYEKEKVLDSLNMRFEAGKTYGITGQSGVGKTTLLKVILGLVKPNGGEYHGGETVKAAVFQENRLFEEYTALENVYATGQCDKTVDAIQKALLEILPKDCLSKPVKEFSGGMKRRADVARAMLSEGEVVLLDEPFNGLDEKTKEQTIAFINKYKQGRTILFTTHCPADIEIVKAEEYKL